MTRLKLESWEEVKELLKYVEDPPKADINIAIYTTVDDEKRIFWVDLL